MKHWTITIFAMLLLSPATHAADAAATPPRPMLDMTFPEFEAAVARTDIMLLPLGAIEEHGPYLPIGSDGMHAVGQMTEVSDRMRSQGIDSIVGPPLNIGLTYAMEGPVHPGANVYPGNLSVRTETFMALYVDVLRSLRENGVRRVFLYSGHFASQQIEAMTAIAQQATASVSGLSVHALVPKAQLSRIRHTPGPHLVVVDFGADREFMGSLLGMGPEPVTATHADGFEISIMLHFRPDLVRAGFENQPYAPSSAFMAALQGRDRTKNPNGTGGFPANKATAAAGARIAAYRTQRLTEAILGTLKGASRDQ